MNWKVRYRKPKSGSICKPKPPNKRRVHYDGDHFMNQLKEFTLKGVRDWCSTNERTWWYIEDPEDKFSGHNAAREDFEVIR